MNDALGTSTRFGYDTSGSPMMMPWTNQDVPIEASKRFDQIETP